MSEDFDDAPVTELERDVRRDSATDDLARDLKFEELRKSAQANDLRGRFFWLAALLALVTVLTSAGLVIAVLAGAEIDSVVAVGFISGLAVETVGVLAIMAGYLFPRTQSND